MTYNEVKKQFMEDVKRELYERKGMKVEISNNMVNKINTSYDAVTVTPTESSVGINLNFEEFYKDFSSGADYDEIIDEAVEFAYKHLEEGPQYEVESLTNYELMKDKLVMEVVSAEINKDILENIPHKMMEDLAVVYRFIVATNGGERATVLATNNLLESMGITPEQLHADALKNSPEIRPAVIRDVTEVLQELLGPTMFSKSHHASMPNDVMYVASVPDNIHGAGVLAYEEFMDKAAERVGGNFFILPSSVHEILLVKDDGETSYEIFKDMVEEVNAACVREEEKLSDNVYHYDAENHIFELAQKYEERVQDIREVPLSYSVLKNLKDKQEEVAAKDVSVREEQKKATKSKGGEAL